MNAELYDGVAVLVVASHLDAEVPYETVGGMLAHDGWVDLVQTIRTVYPSAFLAMCAQHQAEIEEKVGLVQS